MEVLTIMNSRHLGNMASGPAQKGAALVVGLLVIMVLSMIGVSAAKSNVGQQRMANNYRFSIEAMNNAEIGITNVLNVINDQELSVNGFDDELDPNGDGIPDDSFRINVANPDTNVFFTVVVVDDDDGDGNPAVDSNDIVRLMSQGISNVGSTRTIDVRIGVAVGVGGGISLDKAILAHETIELSGNSEFYGSNQDIHSNQDILQADHPISTGTMSAVGTVYGEPGGGTAVSNADYVDIPQVNPGEFAEYADYVFHSDGTIYDEDGGFVAFAFGVAHQGWKFDGAKWSTDGTDVMGGFLYFMGDHGNVVISSAVGSVEDRWEVSILADGYIEISGQSALENYMDPDDPLAVQAIMLMSGSDVKINGNSNQRFNGIIAAREQFEISGNPGIEGAIIAEGASSDSDLVKENKISGVMQMTYNGTYMWPSDDGGGGRFAIALSWRDQDIARNTGVFSPEGQGEGY